MALHESDAVESSAPFHPSQFIETAEIFVSELHFIQQGWRELCHRRGFEFPKADTGELATFSRLIERLRVFLHGGRTHLILCRHRTEEYLRLFWQNFEPLAEKLEPLRSGDEYPTVTKLDIDRLHGLCQLIREAENVRFATPEEEQRAIDGHALEIIRASTGPSKTEAIAAILRESKKLGMTPKQYSRFIVSSGVFPPDVVFAEEEIVEIPVHATEPPRDAEAVLKSPSGRVQLFKPGEAPLVDSKPTEALTDAGYDVVAALLRAGENGLAKRELSKRSKHSDAVGVLKRLAKKSPWKAVIQLPAKTGKGYRIR